MMAAPGARPGTASAPPPRRTRKADRHASALAAATPATVHRYSSADTAERTPAVKGKRLLAARALAALGLAPLWRRRNRRQLLVFNYHRIRPRQGLKDFTFDLGVFGPDQDVFEAQVAWLKGHTRLIGEEQLYALISGREAPEAGPYTMITFDDGYIDNYTLAFPALRRQGAPAVMFIPTGALNQRRLGWWDHAAYLVGASRAGRLTLPDGLVLEPRGPGGLLPELLAALKGGYAPDAGRVLEHLYRQLGVEPPGPEAQSAQLMEWEQVREMADAGIGIGSHTQSHTVLSRLEPARQEQELRNSKEEIERRIGRPVASLAYPVGGPRHFGARTMEIAAACGYCLAFSFNTGRRDLSGVNPMAVPRVGAPPDLETLQAICRFPRLMVTTV